jgi:hypothetical protein
MDKYCAPGGRTFKPQPPVKPVEDKRVIKAAVKVLTMRMASSKPKTLKKFKLKIGAAAGKKPAKGTKVTTIDASG